MRYAQIRDMDIVNGQGIAVSLFVQGCPFHCNGCFNQSTWDFDGGKEWTLEVEDKFIELCDRDFITCVSILGGEPLVQDVETLKCLFKRIKKTNKLLYVWTGYELNNIPLHVRMIVDEYVDYLITGQFVESKRDLNLKLRGSSNQRIWHKTNQETQKWEDITRIIDKNS